MRRKNIEWICLAVVLYGLALVVSCRPGSTASPVAGVQLPTAIAFPPSATFQVQVSARTASPYPTNSPYPTDTPYPTFTAAASPSATPIVPVTSARPTPAIPTPRPILTPLQPSPTVTLTRTACQPDMQFVADVTIPDGAILGRGEAFTKKWRVRSSGCAAWPAGSRWTFVSGSQMGAPNSVTVPATPLGGTADLSVPMTAPATPGNYQGVWQMRTAEGESIGQPVWVKVVIPAPQRPATGTWVQGAGGGSGLGKLTIDNGRDVDAVAVLASLAGTPLRAVYVRAGESFTLTSIGDGSYQLYFTVGEDWDLASGRFTRQPRYVRFEKNLDFQTSGLTYTAIKVTLHPVPAGTARTQTVSPDDFPRLK
jgi:hypothetical protein